MSADVHFQLEGFDEWVAWLRNCQSSELQKMNERIGRALVIQGFNNADRHTPTRTGRLKQSMNMGAPESYSKVKATAELVEATYGSNVPYTGYVELGFTQNAGQFVPGYWSGGKFIYVKGASTGMVLTGKTVAGCHMFEKSLDDLRDGDLTDITVSELRRLFATLG